MLLLGIIFLYLKKVEMKSSIYSKVIKINETIIKGLYLKDNKKLPLKSSIMLLVFPQPGQKYPVKILKIQGNWIM